MNSGQPLIFYCFFFFNEIKYLIILTATLPKFFLILSVAYCYCSLRHALDIREHYERKLERANNLYMELSAIMLQLEVREKELMK